MPAWTLLLDLVRSSPCVCVCSGSPYMSFLLRLLLPLSFSLSFALYYCAPQ